jgi:hypothetical protein
MGVSSNGNLNWLTNDLNAVTAEEADIICGRPYYIVLFLCCSFSVVGHI